MIASRLSLKSIKKRRTNSSTKEDLPAPPVPVIPNTGVFDWSANFLICLILFQTLLENSQQQKLIVLYFEHWINL